MAALAACDLRPETSAPPPEAEPEAPPIPVVQRSEASLELEQYYNGVQTGLLTRGLLRTDGGGPDVPFTADDLVTNFRQIAFFKEFSDNGSQMVPRETRSRLHRWEKPIRIEVTFGPSVPMEIRARDGQAITAYAERLSRVTGHSIRQVSQNGNYHVFIQYEDERQQIGPELRDLIPGISNSAVDAAVNMPRSSYCLVFATTPSGSNVYSKAVSLIRAENPDLMRLSCIHEEIAQGLGLANDSPAARPSIFNDDEEFALLTTMDEKLLTMLFDPRLEPGMSAEEAEPILPVIASEIMGEAST